MITNANTRILFYKQCIYCIDLLISRVKEAIYSETNLKDKGRVSTSAYLYGYGDGGGGPTENMLERAKRLKDCDGVPKLVTRVKGCVDKLRVDTWQMKLHLDAGLCR